MGATSRTCYLRKCESWNNRRVRGITTSSTSCVPRRRLVNYQVLPARHSDRRRLFHIYSKTCTSVDDMDDSEEFDATVAALDALGVKGSELEGHF